MAFTLANAKTYLQDRNREDTSARAVREYVKIANEANRALRAAGDWDFDKRFERVSFAGRYNTGTVSVSAGGTTVTGSGTTFTSAMVGRFIRMNGEDLLYRITAFGSGTSVTIETYQGESALSAVAYEIVDERQALPVRFRKMACPIIDRLYSPLYPQRLEDIKDARQRLRNTSYPYFYAVEWAESSSIPLAYLWLNPAPLDKRVVEVPYYAWPIELASDSDVFNIPSAGEPVMYKYLDAFLEQVQGKTNDFLGLLTATHSLAREYLAQFRAVDEHQQRIPWTPGGDMGDRRVVTNVFAPGEPRFTDT